MGGKSKIIVGFFAGIVVASALSAAIGVAQRRRDPPPPSGPPPLSRDEAGSFLRAPHYVQERIRGTIQPRSRAEWRVECPRGEVVVAGGCELRRDYSIYVWRSLPEEVSGTSGWSCGVMNEGERPLSEPVVDAWAMCAPSGLI